MLNQRLDRSQYDELQRQFDKLPDLSTSYASTGEHYILRAIINRLGFHPGDREETIKLAERLLSNGYSS